MDALKSMDALKKIPLPWIVVGLLSLILIIVLFRQRRSGYTLPTGNVITMMDLQEYSAFSPEQKANYVNILKDYQPKLTRESNSFMTYNALLGEVMTRSMLPPPMNGMQGQPMCPAGMFSSNGKQPGCMACPPGTFCPDQGMTKPKECPVGMTSQVGSLEMTACKSPMDRMQGQSMCPAGMYSPTGKQPGCMPCPMGTFCPMEGMTSPMRCPAQFTSPMGSREMTACSMTSGMPMNMPSLQR